MITNNTLYFCIPQGMALPPEFWQCYRNLREDMEANGLLLVTVISEEFDESDFGAAIVVDDPQDQYCIEIAEDAASCLRFYLGRGGIRFSVLAA